MPKGCTKDMETLCGPYKQRVIKGYGRVGTRVSCVLACVRRRLMLLLVPESAILLGVSCMRASLRLDETRCQRLRMLAGEPGDIL